jgi:hypothetical protein
MGSSQRTHRPNQRTAKQKMSARSPVPLAVAIMALILAIVSYGIKDDALGRVAYGSGLISAAFALLHWLAIPLPKHRSPPRS